MAVPTQFLWEHLGDETKAHLIGHFVEFVLSNRGTRHPQHRLAYPSGEMRSRHVG
jgi:hypothetical protein